MRLASLPGLALIASLVIVAGCSNNNADKIEGNWSSEAISLKDEEVPAGARILQFRKDGHLLYAVAGKTFMGSYSMGMGESVTFTLDSELDGRKIHPHKIVINDDRLTLIGADGSELYFRKADDGQSQRGNP